MPSWKSVQDRESGAVSEEAVDLKQDEGNRPDTTLDGLAALKGAVPGVTDTSITAGNSVAALRRRGGGGDRRLGVRRAAQSRRRWDIYRGYAVAATEPGEMGIAPGLCRAETAEAARSNG